MRRTFRAGDKVEYIAGPNKSYIATVTGIPDNPWHCGCPLPILSLTFQKEDGEIVFEERVLPIPVSEFNCGVYRETGRR
jgi:hypothetical protein